MNSIFGNESKEEFPKKIPEHFDRYQNIKLMEEVKEKVIFN